jgi:hypothetical protein
MVVHVYNPSTGENEAGGSQVASQPELYTEFKASLSYISRPYLKKKKEREIITDNIICVI